MSAEGIRTWRAWALGLALAGLGTASLAGAPADAPGAAGPASRTDAPRSADGRLQLRCLAEKPKAPRFKKPVERVWPEKPGEADICLWADDKFAALSLTIDDNHAQEHAWWIEQGRKHGLKFTWFVVTNSVESHPGVGGTWAGWRKVAEAGHDVESHTVTHLSSKVDILTEYRDSQAVLEKEIPGSRCLVLAYPGGGKIDNDRALAARHYIGARGTVGVPNNANQTDYLQTSSIGAQCGPEVLDVVLYGRSATIPWLNNKAHLRDWLCVHYHSVYTFPGSASEEEKKAKADKCDADLAYVKSKEADVWVGTFREVAQYGQERDTARLEVTASTAEQIRFSLTDDMDDTLFDYPLTVKVRLPADWPGAKATQGGKPARRKVIEHEGGRFALVQAVPDRGDVLLSRQAE